MCGKLQEMRAEELGWDLMELTAHEGARPSHAEWQGGIVSLSGKSGYLSKEAIGYGEVDGFKGINCRHDWFPYYEGSSRAYSEEQLEQYKNAKVTYNGKIMSLYDATQLQRSIERQIRVDKKKIAGRKKLLTSITTDKTEKELKSSLNYYKAKLELDKNNLNDLLKQTSLTNQAYRTKISAKGEYNTKSVVNYAEKLYNSSSKTSNLQSFVDDEIIRKHIRNNYNLTLNEGAQDKHIIGTNNYNTEIANGNHPSIIYLNNEEIQDIINKYAGTGKPIRNNSPNNTFKNKELVIISELTGINVEENTGKETETHRFIIHYSKTGTHLVPTKEID